MIRHALALTLAAIPTVAIAEAPSVLSRSERENYVAIFAAIDSKDWAGANTRLDAMPQGPLHAAARAELYLAKDSPTATLEQLTALINAAPDAPQSAQLSRLAVRRGALTPPLVVEPQTLVWGGTQPRRQRPKATNGDPGAAALEPQIQPLLVNDQPAAAEALLTQYAPQLSPSALTEYRQRLAWVYYLNGYNAEARRLAALAQNDGGDWAVHARWTGALAAWRMRDYRAAADEFAMVGARSSDAELAAAGKYWAARADLAAERPERVQAYLRAAATASETFYGMLAARALGLRIRAPGANHDYRDEEYRGVAGKPNGRAAIALSEIGRAQLADEYLRYQARIAPGDYRGLLHLAASLNLASTQHWLAHNVPRGQSTDPAARYPSPTWTPAGGWRVERPLALAHALQESNFRTQVVSPAGAVGVLQVRPGTAGDIARARGRPFDVASLKQPEINLDYGQAYIQQIRDNPATGGLLPKVIAAYNAGPVPVTAWNARNIGQGDPLLYIESLPYWETRGYIPIILRNYWIYQQQAGDTSPSRDALAQGLWPRFPGLKGSAGVRLTGPAGLNDKAAAE